MEENITSYESQTQLTSTSVEYIRSIGKWLKFMGVMMIVGIVFLVLAAIGMFVGMDVLADPGTAGAEMPMGLLGGIYLVCAALYVIPTTYLMRASNAAADFVVTGVPAQLETFLKNNKSYWKFCGILTITALSLAVLGIVVGIAIAIIAI